MTVVENLDQAGTDFAALAGILKAKCGSGGTVKDGRIELQGDHVAAALAVLVGLGYRAKRG